MGPSKKLLTLVIGSGLELSIIALQKYQYFKSKMRLINLIIDFR